MGIFNTFAWLIITLKFVESANILMITMGGTKSHKVPFVALAKGLIAKSHTITLVSGFVADSDIQGLEEVAPKNLVDYIHNYTDWDLVGARMSGKFPVSFLKVLRYPHESCEAFLTDVKTKAILSEKYDLAILDGAFLTCSLGVVYRLQVPFMHINTVAFYSLSLSAAGNPAPYSISPNLLSSYTDSLSLLERADNALMHILMHGFYLYSSSKVHRVLKKHLGEDVPNPITMSKHASFILQNGHSSLTYPRPLNPNVAEIACIHCHPSSPLQKELEEFVTSGDGRGFIYFSMGSSVKPANLPEEFLHILVDVFTRLPYQVLWKYDGLLVDVENLPGNIKIVQWLPQQDILGHKAIKAFVTHGGLLSMFEAVYHGVPMVMMPVFCDHDLNTVKAVNDGIAVAVLLESVTAENLFNAIVDVTEDSFYREAIRKKQLILHDQMSTPLETAVFWTEYVLRHDGAVHLMSASRNMSWTEYYLVDVAALYMMLVMLGASVLKTIFQFSWRV